MAVALGTVFILNAIALFIFPAIGAALHLSQSHSGCGRLGDSRYEFGGGRGNAVWQRSVGDRHDREAGPGAVDCAAGARYCRVQAQKSKVQMPWFIVLFCIAAVINTLRPARAAAVADVFPAWPLGLTCYVVLDRNRNFARNPERSRLAALAQGLLLWILVGVTSLYFIHNGWIAL